MNKAHAERVLAFQEGVASRLNGLQMPLSPASYLEKALQASLQSLRHKQEHDMKIGQMTAGKFLKKDDVDPPLLLTVQGFEEENVAPEDKPKELKWVMYFEETDKGLVMNTTNLQLGAIAMGSQETDDWVGKQFVVFNDPTVSYAGKITGGVRIRAPKKSVTGKSSVKAPDPRPEPPDEDPDVPF